LWRETETRFPLGRKPTSLNDEQIVSLVNGITSATKVIITEFSDDSISDSKPLLTLLDIIKPDSVDWSLYDKRKVNASKIKNVLYVLSVIRKLGGTVYALPEDIVEHDPQMVMTVYASILSLEPDSYLIPSSEWLPKLMERQKSKKKLSTRDFIDFMIDCLILLFVLCVVSYLLYNHFTKTSN
jgi:hypothetical protein